MPAADVEDEIEAAWLDVERRRAARYRRGGNGRTFRCPSCKKFVRNPSGFCPHCGYHQTIGHVGGRR